MFKKSNILILAMLGLFILSISAVSATENITDNMLADVPDETTNISVSDESAPVSEDSLNPDVKIYLDDNLLAFQAPADIYDNLNLYVNNANYGHSCDLNNRYGIIKEASVKNTQGDVVSVYNMDWTKLKFTLNGKTATLTSDEYQQLKDHKTIHKYVGVKKVKYISKYKKVKKTYYKTKLLGKAYKSRIGAIILSKLIGVKNTVKYLNSIDKTLSNKVKKQIKKMKKKGWKLDYTYKKTNNGVYKVYGEFYKTKKVKSPVYKYKSYNNYMTFKYTSKGYVAEVDSNDGQYVYSKTFALI